MKLHKKLFDNLKQITPDDFKKEMDIFKTYHDLYAKSLTDKQYLFPVVIDWLDGSHQKNLEEKTKGHIC